MSNSGASTRTAHIVLVLALMAAGGAVRAEDGVRTVLVSRQLAQARGLEVGQVVRLSTNADGTGALAFRVAGTYEPVPNPFILADKRLEARLHLPDLARMRNPRGDLLAAESVTRVNVELKREVSADAFARLLTARMPGLVVSPALQSVESGDPFLVLERFHLAIAAITVIGSSAFLLALMVMRSDERRETAGILRLIGLSRPRILLEGFFEGLIIAVAGAAFGVCAAVSMQGLFNRFFQWYYDTALVFVDVTPSIVVRCVLLAVPLGVAAGLFASWTLLRREILELLRR